MIGWYRQWSYTYENKPFHRLSFIEMNKRFEDQLIKIMPLAKAETIIAGDLNIYYKIMYKNEEEKTPYEIFLIQ